MLKQLGDIDLAAVVMWEAIASGRVPYWSQENVRIIVDAIRRNSSRAIPNDTITASVIKHRATVARRLKITPL